MNPQLDELYAKCKMLTDDELYVLMNGLRSEADDRKNRQQRESWNQVISAINAYTEEYGSIEICNGNEYVIFLHNRAFTHTPGEIIVE